MKQAVIIFISLFLFSSAVYALPFTEDIMKIGTGARPMGMGKAFTAVADDGNCVFFNPAGLAGLPGWQAMSMYTSLFGSELPYVVFTGSTPFRSGELGFGVISATSGQIASPSAQGLSYFDYYDNLYFITYAMDASKYFDDNKVYIGSNLKMFSEGITGSSPNSGTGLSMDFGLKFMPNDIVSLGLNVQNAVSSKISWTSGSQDDIPMTVKAGTAVKLSKGDLLLALDGDFYPGRNLPSPAHFGAEWHVNKYLALRAGIDQMISAASNISNNPTAGIGLKLSGFSIDYAYHAFSDNPSYPAHFVSISYQWEPKAAKPITPAVPAVVVTIETVSKILSSSEASPANEALPGTAAATQKYSIVEVVSPVAGYKGKKIYKVRILNISSRTKALMIKQRLLSAAVDSILREGDDGNYYLQAGVFKNKTAAQKLLNKLKKRRFYPVIISGPDIQHNP